MERKKLPEVEVDLHKGQKYHDKNFNSTIAITSLFKDYLVILEPFGTRTVNRYMFEQDVQNGILTLVKTT